VVKIGSMFSLFMCASGDTSPGLRIRGVVVVAEEIVEGVYFKKLGIGSKGGGAWSRDPGLYSVNNLS
jgi:hypothetical protein